MIPYLQTLAGRVLMQLIADDSWSSLMTPTILAYALGKVINCKTANLVIPLLELKSLHERLQSMKEQKRLFSVKKVCIRTNYVDYIGPVADCFFSYYPSAYVVRSCTDDRGLCIRLKQVNCHRLGRLSTLHIRLDHHYFSCFWIELRVHFELDYLGLTNVSHQCTGRLVDMQAMDPSQVSEVSLEEHLKRNGNAHKLDELYEKTFEYRPGDVGVLQDARKRDSFSSLYRPLNPRYPQVRVNFGQTISDSSVTALQDKNGSYTKLAVGIQDIFCPHFNLRFQVDLMQLEEFRNAMTYRKKRKR